VPVLAGHVGPAFCLQEDCFSFSTGGVSVLLWITELATASTLL
jgi:hypothetical protein